ncbi:MAG: GAF and ANTAR domain-containing protein [Actinobacteria bacterium]|nr:GAF and ANTAR domain-containing protein [Actinomycetota bacterium]
MPFSRTESFAELARVLATRPTLADTLQTIVERAAVTVPGAEEASITIKRREQRYQTVASTGELPRQVDDLQYRTQEGPCLQAIEEHHVFRTDDLRCETRWPKFALEVTLSTEAISMMSHRLFLEDADTIGALNLYARKPAAFATLDVAALDDLATHCAIALTTAAEREQNQNLRLALETNRDIGVAMGILMATKLVTKQQSFDALRITSQHTHRKLHQVALDVIESGELPRFGPARSAAAHRRRSHLAVD